MTTPLEQTLRLLPTPSIFNISTANIIYRLLVRRRVPISLILFSTILIAEVLLGIGWQRINLQSDILFGTAVALVVLGVSIRSWAAGTIRKSSVLATTGAYSLCRHPLYLGSFLMISGACLGTQPLINFPIVAPCVGVIYVCAIRSEEARLARLFGEAWHEYSAITPRLLPSLLRSNFRLTRWSLEQWRDNREYQAAFATIAGLGGMFTWYMFG